MNNQTFRVEQLLRLSFLLGIVYVVLYIIAQPARTGLWIVVDVMLAGALVSISVIDIFTYRIPNIISGPMMIVGVGVIWQQNPDLVLMHTVGAVLSFLLFVALDYGFLYLRGRHGLGMGDAKLIAAGILWLGPFSLPDVLMLASASAIVITLLRRGNRFTKIPFGPYLALAIWWVWIMEGTIFLQF